MDSNKKVVLDGIEYLPLDDPKTQTKLAEKRALEFPRLSTLVGEGIIYPLVGWVEVNLKGREPFEVACFAAETKDGKAERVTLASLVANATEFVNADGKVVSIDNVVSYIAGESTAERNDRILSLIPSTGIKVNARYIYGHYRGQQKNKDHYVVEKS